MCRFNKDFGYYNFILALFDVVSLDRHQNIKHSISNKLYSITNDRDAQDYEGVKFVIVMTFFVYKDKIFFRCFILLR